MNLTKFANINHLWSALLVEELIRNGINYFCLSPGSRSSPLAVAVGENSAARRIIHYDERGSAFHALGYVAATKRPAVLISTSGTAAANFLPAVIETSKKKLPLIILTADRPPELRKTGADQTIDQTGLFGEYARWQFDMPCPDQAIKPEFLLTTVDQAIHRANGSPKGPVHINCMFREPLAPIKQKVNAVPYCIGIHRWTKAPRPYTQYIVSEKKFVRTDVQKVSAVVNAAARGIIVVGKLGGPSESEAVLKIAEKIGWPVFPDITSGLRLGCRHPNVVPYFDQILLFPKLADACKPGAILHLGGRMTSKRWYQYIEKLNPADYVMVNNHPLRNDPLHNVSLRVEFDVGEFCRAVLPELKKKSEKELSVLGALSQIVARQLKNWSARQTTLTEIMTARIISENIPADNGLFLASSMPTRDMDMYATPAGKQVVVASNRGASGIDGTVASASGFAAGSGQPVTLLIGDLALLHDLNSLALVAKMKIPVIIIVINNDGGGIFSFLPIVEFGKTFEEFFGTPHGLRFENAAAMFGLAYQKLGASQDFKQCYLQALKSGKPAVIEVQSDRKQNRKAHRMLQRDIVRALDKYFQK